MPEEYQPVDGDPFAASAVSLQPVFGDPFTAGAVMPEHNSNVPEIEPVNGDPFAGNEESSNPKEHDHVHVSRPLNFP